MSLLVQSPDNMLWSDASDQGWDAAVADQLASGPWLEGEDLLSINHRELLAVERGLFQLRRHLRRHVVAMFSDNSTAVAYLCHQGSTLSPALTRSLSESFVGRSERRFPFVHSSFLGRTMW